MIHITQIEALIYAYSIVAAFMAGVWNGHEYETDRERYRFATIAAIVWPASFLYAAYIYLVVEE